MGRFNIVCIDASKFSENAFNWYVENYHRDDDILGMIHVHQMPGYPSSFGVMGYAGAQMIAEYNKMIVAGIKEAKALLLKFKGICDEKKIESRSFLVDSSQSLGHTICELLVNEKADAVFIGQRGLGTISRMIVGSTSDYVIHHAHIPVTVIPTASKEE